MVPSWVRGPGSMAKFVSPLLGFNNNVRHKNRVFHIQTEDSGINHPHIITHLFMDGGRILKSVKTSYAEHVGTEKMSDTVRQMMKEQHKAMFIALRDGQFDHLVEGGAPKKPDAAAAPAKAPATSEAKVEAAKPAEAAADTSDTDVTQRLPAQSEETAAAVLEPAPKTDPEPPREEDADAKAPSVAPKADAKPASVAPRSAAAAIASLPPVEGPFRAVASAVPPPVAPGPASTRLGIAAPAPTSIEAGVAKASPAAGIAAHRAESTPREDPSASRTASGPPVAPVAATPGSAPPASKVPSVKDLTLDFDALDRATPEDGAPLYRGNDLPPPPATLFAKHTSGGYRAVESQAPRRDPREEPESPGARPAARPSPQPARLSAMPRGAQAATPAEGAGGPPRETPRAPADQRYAPARPATIFGASATRPQPASIFSDELISDKSLDEVILSYLAEDLEPPRRK